MSAVTPRAVTFALPWPPSVNAAYRSVLIGGKVRVLLSREGRAYKDAARVHLMQQCVPCFGTARVAVEVIVFPPDRRARDLGNLDKLLMDAMEPQVFHNDSQIDYLVFDRSAWRIVPGGRLHVTVTDLGEQAGELAAGDPGAASPGTGRTGHLLL